MLKKTILIVEDEKPMSVALVDKFSRAGFKVLEASDGEEGLKIALKEKPDLILIDILMSKMDGMTMAKKLRGDSWGKDAKIIFLTNVQDTALVAEAAEIGIYDFLVKTDWKLDDVIKMAKEKFSTS